MGEQGGTGWGWWAGYAAAFVAGGALFVYGLVQWTAIHAVGGVVCLVAVLVTAPVFARLRARGADSTATDRLVQGIESLVREQGLSEVAKRVLHRREERELLRRAIEQDIRDQDWDAAMVLVKELAEQFGYRQDAEEFRQRIERVQAQSLDSRAVEALETLDEEIRNGRWAEAYAEAARIQRLYPESHRVDGLRERVDEARLRYRADLERRFLRAAEREEVDEAMRLLKELDSYLTPTEAEPLAEVARGVVVKSRENLGAQFKLAVGDQRWADALEVGERIMREFPNTRMAEEIREMAPQLRQRSGEAGVPNTG